MFSVGDVVVYVGPPADEDLSWLTPSDLAKGSVHRVLSVHLHPFREVEGIRVRPDSGIIISSSFRKLDAADEGFKALIQRVTKPEPAHA